MQIGFIGKGVFGEAISSLVIANGYTPQFVDVGDTFAASCDVVFLTVPVQHMRGALEMHKDMFAADVRIVNCCKGIEKDTAALPHQIVEEVLGEVAYVAISGPSFASEIVAKVPTTVSIAASAELVVDEVAKLLTTPYFIVEKVGTVLELELAGAMKNIYAVASGYVAGSGGGKNTHAHVQVVALREYTKLIRALEGSVDVVRPGVVGDLILTCGSNESRNYQYGHALASGIADEEATVEGRHSAAAVHILTEKHSTPLLLAEAIYGLVRGQAGAHDLLYKALGFTI